MPWLEEFKRGEGMDPPRPIVVEGVLPPWVLVRFWEGTKPGITGARGRIWVVEDDPIELMDGLAQADLTEVIADARVTFVVGPGVAEKLRDQLGAKIELSMPGSHVSSRAMAGSAPATAGIAGGRGSAVVEAIRALHTTQEAEHRRLITEVNSIYAGRDRAWWARRYAHATRPASDEPLRILLPVSRYSTFVRHSASDVAESLRAMGHEARVLSEPDDASRLASIAYLREFASWKPDLVVLIN
ncbi:MAG TPA: hypothetical protein VG797_07295, partial [Phycisphaerales bacterium]|nr:hypothetical protein [Phycisphaerales bacterium]